MAAIETTTITIANVVVEELEEEVEEEEDGIGLDQEMRVPRVEREVDHLSNVTSPEAVVEVEGARTSRVSILCLSQNDLEFRNKSISRSRGCIRHERRLSSDSGDRKKKKV